MEINISFLGNQKINANFDGLNVIADQPVSNKGEGLFPSPFDYFLASLGLCAGYFVKAYCDSRDISMEGIKIVQNNLKNDPENKYKQKFVLNVTLPDTISEKDKLGILRAIEGCSVKKAINSLPEFEVKLK